MTNKSGVNNPAISVPKGGGAIKGIGETFQPDLFTGTGNFSVPIITSPGRNDFRPQLTLQYSTGSGNGPFGLGWQLSIPRITRKTEKGIPKYTDEDIFVMSGAEDLVPVLDKDSDLPFYTIRENYTIYRYRPRTEGLFARIEKWVRNDGDIHWCVITKENITNIYGKTASARLFDINNTRHIFEWLLEESFDAKGNHILYEYEKESPNIEISKIYEENREYNQIYVRRVLYGNVPDDLDESKKVGPVRIGSDGTANGTKSRCYLFEVLFDYGDLPILPSIPYNHLDFSNKYIDEWPIREDIFSSFRSGFEIRTLRRCQRVLILHHFAEGELVGAPFVKSTNFEYSINKDTQLSMLKSIKAMGYKKSNSNIYISSEMPPVTFNYSEFMPLTQKFQSISIKGNDFPPTALNDPNCTLIDLFGNGLPDILYTTENAYYYWRNMGEGNFDRRNIQQNMPIGITLSNPDVAMGDMGGDGLADIIIRTPSRSGFYEATPIGTWKPYKMFDQIPSFDLSDPNTQLVDLTGDGLSDVILSFENYFLWYKCLGELGYDEPKALPRIYDLNEFPDVYFNDPEGRIRFADMNGDGLNDIVMIHNGRIDYWTNLGYGRFSKRLTMENFPNFDYTFNLKRLFLVDLDGSGCDDLVYVDFNKVDFWFNQSGNKWSDKQTIIGTPNITDSTSIQFADIYGTGLQSLVWSYNYDEHPDKNYKVLDFCGGVKPYLLNEMSNNMGSTTRIKYAPSTKFYLEDIKNNREWVTNIPFPVQVVDNTEIIDHLTKTKIVNVYKYHHGYYDGREREFRGFGQVDQYDTEIFEIFANSSLHEDDRFINNTQKGYHVPPVLTKTWFHLGIYFDENISSANNQFCDETDMMDSYKREFFNGDSYAFNFNDHAVEKGGNPHEAYRSLRGSIIRTEVYGLDNTAKQNIPYIVTETCYQVNQLQARKSNQNAVYFPIQKESLIYHYERNPNDPRINHQITLGIDDYGNITDRISIVYPRRPYNVIYEEQNIIKVTYSWSKFINEDIFDADHENFYYIGIPCETKIFEINGVLWEWSLSSTNNVECLKSSDFSTIIGPTNFKPFSYIPPKELSILEKRLIEWNRSYYRKNENPIIIDEIGNLSNRLQLGKIESLGLMYESYTACFTDQMLKDIYGENMIKPWQDGGYHPHPSHPKAEVDASNYWWVPSGRQSYNPKKYYQVEQTQNPFGDVTKIEYDKYGLMVKTTEDAWSFKHITDADQKHLTVSKLNYRVLEPQRVIDPNGNISEVEFNSLGMVIATARKGMDENGVPFGDSISELVEELEETKIVQQINHPLSNPNDILKNATSRIIIDFNRFFKDGLPNVTYTLSRETHSSEVEGDITKIQHKFVYFDGFGRELQTKLNAESGDLNGNHVTNRWIGTGTKIYNNKGKKVQQFEPFFSDNHHYGIEQYGVSPILFYDPMERIVCTLHPNHTYEKTVIEAWKQEIWDENDNIHSDFRYNPQMPEILPDHKFNPINDPHVGHYFRGISKDNFLPTWYGLRIDTDIASKKWSNFNIRRTEENSAKKTGKHSATPTIFHLDGLSRNFLTIRDNGKDDLGNDVFLETRINWDIEGNDISIIDPRDIMIYHHKFDIFGNKILIESKDSGLSMTFLNVIGNPVYEWDSNNHMTKTIYDELQRPIEVWVKKGKNFRLVVKNIYGDEVSTAKKYNLIGQVYKQYDSAGLVTCHRYDFKNNLIQKTRKVIKDSEIEKKFEPEGESCFIIDWNVYDETILDPQVYPTKRDYDALSRLIKIEYPDNTLVSIKYNERNLIKSIDVNGEPFIKNIKYEEKGQRKQILYGNDVQTKYDYDPTTFLLKRLWTRMNQGTGKYLQDLTYFYDPSGNILKIDDKTKSGENRHVIERLLEHYREYIYDPLYKLICAKGKESINVANLKKKKERFQGSIDPTATQTYFRKYFYDNAGNIVRINHKTLAQGNVIERWTKNYVYGNVSPQDMNNRLKVITNQEEKNISFDSNGNVISIAHNQHFYWDHANYMIGATNSTLSNPSDASMQAQYFYDINGMRVKKVVKCGTVIKTLIYIDDIYEIYQKRTKMGLKEHKIYKHIMDGTNRIAIIKDTIHETKPDNEPKILYHHRDLLGSSQVLTDMDGKLFNQEEYYPFGETSFGSYAKKRYRYNGKERDNETGLYYFGVRYYSPYLKRWMSCDPAGQDEGINAYIFAKNNPVTLRDPVGLQDEPPRVNESQNIQNLVGQKPPFSRRERKKRKKAFNELTKEDIYHTYQSPILNELREFLSDVGHGSYWLLKDEGTMGIKTSIGKDAIIYNTIATNGDTVKDPKWSEVLKRLNRMFEGVDNVRVVGTPVGKRKISVPGFHRFGPSRRAVPRDNHAAVKLVEDHYNNRNVAKNSKEFISEDRKTCVTCRIMIRIENLRKKRKKGKVVFYEGPEQIACQKGFEKTLPSEFDWEKFKEFYSPVLKRNKIRGRRAKNELAKLFLEFRHRDHKEAY